MHSSMSARNDKGKCVNNERLEFLGDAILDAVVGEIVFHHFQRKREGFLTTARSKIVQRETLGYVAVQTGLDKLIHAQSHTPTHNSYMAGNAFEALIGAIYLDRGYDCCLRFMRDRILGRIISIDRLAFKESNFKSKLLEWAQKHKRHLEFRMLEEIGDGHKKEFHVQVFIDDQPYGDATFRSIRGAEQMAAEKTFKTLNPTE